MRPELQVKQYVGIVCGARDNSFMVFRTGSDKHYLFAQLYPNTTTQTGLEFPVLKADLHDEVRRALANGYGNRPERAEGQNW